MRLTTALLVGVASVAIGLTGCSKNNSNNNGAAAVGTSDAAQTSGVGDQSGYQGQSTSANGEKVNSLVAPSNQYYYFDYDDNTVRQADYKSISVQANYLVAHPSAKIRLEGNTDNRGSREYNIGLGWRRDQAVARLYEQQGVSPKQIDMVSYGKERPVAMGNDESAWHLNRRVDLVYESK